MIAAAADPERRCKYCGCSDERACPGGCAWVTDDVCSSKACVERAYFDGTFEPLQPATLEQLVDGFPDFEEGWPA